MRRPDCGRSTETEAVGRVTFKSLPPGEYGMQRTRRGLLGAGVGLAVGAAAVFGSAIAVVAALAVVVLAVAVVAVRATAEP